MIGKIFGIKKKKRHSNRTIWGNASIFIFLTLIGMFMLVPIIYAFINSLKPLDELFLFPPRFFVKRPTTFNYYLLFKLTANLRVPFSRYIFNSMFVSIFATVIHVLIASMAAYPFAKYKLKISWMFKVIIMALLFNATVLWLPQYLIMSKLNIINTYFAYIIPALPSALGFFLMKQFMEQIPFSIIDSARIDGANQFSLFWKIIMPQVKPAWLTLVVFAFQGIWNQQFFGVVYDEQLKLINDAIAQIISGGYARLGVSMAGSVLLMIPPVIVFVFAQNKVIETMVHSGIKG